jgi:protein JSN1
MPSTFHLSPSTTNPSASSSSISRSSLAVDSLLAPPPLHNGAASLPGSGATTPLDLTYNPSTLLQNATVNPSSSRLRSGSLTALPPSSGSLSSAFGPGTNVFSSGDWTPRPVQAVGTPIRKPLDDMRSPDGSAYGDEHVRTLDYLGLDDEVPTSSADTGAGSFGSVGEGSFGNQREGAFDGLAPSMHRLGSTGSMRLPQNPLSEVVAQNSRLRSNTVGTFPRTSPSDRPFHQSSHSLSYNNLLSGPILHPSTRSSLENNEDSTSSYHRSNSSTDSARLLYSTTEVDISDNDPSPPPHSSHPPSHPLVTLVDSSVAAQRARAATIGILDESREPLPRRRAGTTVGIGAAGTSPLGIGSLNVPSNDNELSSTSPSSSSHLNGTSSLGRAFGGLSISEDPHYTLPASPYAFPNPPGSRPRSPEKVSMSPPHQQPTRSLWVGNLDPKTTPAELQQVFAPYGAIESLRLIPDKVRRTKSLSSATTWLTLLTLV